MLPPPNSSNDSGSMQSGSETDSALVTEGKGGSAPRCLYHATRGSGDVQVVAHFGRHDDGWDQNSNLNGSSLSGTIFTTFET